MQITQEQFDKVDGWIQVEIPSSVWPNPKALKSERTFFTSTKRYKDEQGKMTRYVLTFREFDKHASQTTN